LVLRIRCRALRPKSVDALLSLAGQHFPDRRRQTSHCGIQANAPGRTALETRFSVIRRLSSIYQRYSGWDIERFFNKLKQFRRVATRYDKLLANFMGFVKLAAIAIWLK
jgi:transposase